MSSSARTLPTPVLNRTLDQLPDEGGRFLIHRITARDIERFERGRKTIEQALADRRIRNQEFLYAKDDISRAFAYALEKSKDGLWKKHEDTARRRDEADLLSEFVSSMFQLNHAPGKVKRLEKFISKHGKRYTGFGPVLELWKEAATVQAAIAELKPLVIKGRKPAENPKPVDLTNMATCAICANLQKMHPNQTMVHHGFRITVHGAPLHQRVGKCFGTDRKPYELSSEANQAFLLVIASNIRTLQHGLARLQAGEVQEFLLERYKKGTRETEHYTVRVGEPAFERELDRRIQEIIWSLGREQRMEVYHQDKVKNWTLKPLPEFA